MIALLFVAMVGLCLGSFVTLASYRLPLDEDIVLTPSRCPHCKRRLRAHDLFPVLSWLSTRGKCRYCHTHVHWRYPFIELLSGVMCVAIYLAYGLSALSAVHVVLFVALLTMIVADLEHYIIPDEVHYVLAPLAIVYRYVLLHDDWLTIVQGGAIGLGFGLMLRFGFRWLRKKEGLGLGDVKFLGVAGLWLDIRTLVPFCFFAGVLGILTALVWRAAGQGKHYPFGPALALAMFLCIVFPALPAFFWHVQDIVFP